RGRRTPALGALLLGAAVCHGPHPVTPSMAEARQRQERRTVKPATDVIEELRKGHEYRRGADAFLAGGAVDASALGALGQALATDGEPVREQLLRLLVAVGKEADPLHAKGIPIVRDRGVVDLLVHEGLRLPGPGRDFALDALDTLVPAELLAHHGRALTD